MLSELLIFFGIATFLVSLERLFAVHREQRALRRGLPTDFAHYLVNAFIVPASVMVLLAPAVLLLDRVVPGGVRSSVAAQGGSLQFLELTVLADLGIYAGHRLLHAVPRLWRFHAIHHSTEEVDWLTAARNHPVDAIFLRAWMLLPGYALGFSSRVWAAYALYYAAQSFFVHANVRVPLGPFALLYAGPDYHRWHHSNAEEARDKNFVTHFPWIDRLFGTLYLPPNRRPDRYGTRDAVPRRYAGQLAYPFRRPV